MIGSFSHIAWDAFTHEGGLVVNLWSGFTRRIGPGAVPVYRWLQYGSSLFGMTLLGVWAHRATQCPAPGSAARLEASSRPRSAGTVPGLRGLGLLDTYTRRRRCAPPPAGSAGAQGSVPALSRARRAVAAAVIGGLLLVGAVGAIRGAHRGDAFDVVKGGGAGAMAGALLSLVLSCAAISRRRPGRAAGAGASSGNQPETAPAAAAPGGGRLSAGNP